MSAGFGAHCRLLRGPEACGGFVVDTWEGGEFARCCEEGVEGWRGGGGGAVEGVVTVAEARGRGGLRYVRSLAL